MRNETIDPDPDSALYLGILYGVYALIGIPANLFVVIATLTNEGLRAVNLNIFVLTLGLGDIIFLLFACSSTLWGFTFEPLVCKIGGVGFYSFAMLNIMTPPCLAITRYAVVSRNHHHHSKIGILTKRSEVLLLNGVLWTFVIIFPIPFIFADKVGLDPMGVCGIEDFNSIGLLLYYTFALMCMMFASYITTLVFYRKLHQWITKTTASMTWTAHTDDTIQVTRNLLKMMKWLTALPLFFMAPATLLQWCLRYDPFLASIRTARIFMITIPLCAVLDPIITISFVRSYRQHLLKLMRCNRGITSTTEDVVAPTTLTGQLARKNSLPPNRANSLQPTRKNSLQPARSTSLRTIVLH